MSAFLFILGGLAFLIGTANILHATTAHHENGAYLLWVVFAVLISGGAVVNAINSLRKEMKSKK